MRGDDWIPSTPKRILIYQAFGWQPPIFIHVPLVLGADGKKLENGTAQPPLTSSGVQGTFPLRSSTSWRCWAGRQVMAINRKSSPLRSSSQGSTFNHINLASAVFSYGKLDWLNGQYIRAHERG